MNPTRNLVLAFPGSLDTRTGGYLYDKRIAQELEARGWTVERLSLPATFPFPSPADLEATRTRLGALPLGSTTLIDGLALGAMSALAAELTARLDVVALVHHPLCLESGLSPERATALQDSERRALAWTRRCIVTSRHTAVALTSLLGVPKERITVAMPGTDPSPTASGSTDGIVRMLCVGTVVPRKGHELLVQALAGVPGKWELAIGGSLERDFISAKRLRAAIASTGLDARVRLLGELSEVDMAARYRAADLFVSASLYEGYGMALAEALARGVPIVAAAGGAVAETVPSEAGLLVPPGDVVAMRIALHRCISDRDLLDGLRRGAMAARARLPTWADTAASVERALAGQPS